MKNNVLKDIQKNRDENIKKIEELIKIYDTYLVMFKDFRKDFESKNPESKHCRFDYALSRIAYLQDFLNIVKGEIDYCHHVIGVLEGDCKYYGK